MKAYIAKKHVQQALRDKRLIETDKYFTMKREEILTDSQVVISYHWRRYDKEKKMKIQKDEEQKQKSRLNSPTKKKTLARPVQYDKVGPSWGFSK